VTVRSEDVTLSVRKPEGLSARNIMKGVVQKMAETEDGAVSIKIDIGVTIYATITKESVSDLSIVNGMGIYIILKTMALSRRSTATLRQ
jgi:molybdate transport system ATP-binding protein